MIRAPGWWREAAAPRPAGGGTSPQGACPPPLSAPCPRAPEQRGCTWGGRGGPSPAGPVPTVQLPGGSGATETSGAPGAARTFAPSLCHVVQPMGLPRSREHIPPCDPESPGLGPARTSATCTEASLTRTADAPLHVRAVREVCPGFRPLPGERRGVFDGPEGVRC